MLIEFKSKASGDVIMLGDSGKAMLRLLGKDADDSKGIFSTEQLPGAIAALKQAIATDKALFRTYQTKRLFRSYQTEKPPNTNSDAGDSVRLAQRALPVLELMERSLQEDTYVTWGV